MIRQKKKGTKRYKVEDRWKWYRHCKVVISEVALDSGIIKLKQGKGKKVAQVITNLTKLCRTKIEQKGKITRANKW